MSSAKRTLLDMDQLVQKWVDLGDKTAAKGAVKSKAVAGSTRKKGLTPQEEIVRGEKARERRVKDDEMKLLLAPVREPNKFNSYDEGARHLDPTDTIEPIDPNSVCPYCDLPLPLNPSERLTTMLDAALPHSTKNVRDENPLGRLLPTIFRAPLCSRHTFETVHIPKAEALGWKTSIDFGEVERHLMNKKLAFEALITNVDCIEGGPRSTNVFWQKANHNALTNSSKLQGVAGNLSTFKSLQPGYYGEQGIRVIHDTFNRLFIISDDFTAPLSAKQFDALVLTPEAGVLLIMEDLNIGREDAIETMLQSGTYGVEMFPWDD